MHVRLSCMWLVNVGYCVWCQHPHWDLLCDDSLTVASKRIVERCIEAVIVVRTGGGEGTIRVRRCGRNDSKSKHGHVVFLREPYLGGGGVYGGLEGSVERGKRHLEVDDIVGRGLYGDRFEDGVLGGVSEVSCGIEDMLLTIERTLHEIRWAADACGETSTHAQTCVPCSGMMVKPTCSSLSFTQASGPSELSDAVSSGSCQLDVWQQKGV